MTLKLLPALLLAVSWQVHAADPCEHANNTIEINECMNKQFVAADRELNRAYQDLLKRIDASDPKHVDRGTVRRRLLEAQRSYRATQTQYVEAQAELSLAQTELTRTMGGQQ